jgi:hypothetical protein
MRARLPFIDWIFSLPESEDIKKDSIDEDGNVYLLPDITLETTRTR